MAGVTPVAERGDVCLGDRTRLQQPTLVCDDALVAHGKQRGFADEAMRLGAVGLWGGGVAIDVAGVGGAEEGQPGEEQRAAGAREESVHHGRCGGGRRCVIAVWRGDEGF